MNQLDKLNNCGVMGAILGDIAGSRFEWHNRKSKEFTIFHRKSKFTDDSVQTLAIMDIINKGHQEDPKMIAKLLQKWCKSFPNCGYGPNFKKWMYLDEPKPYNSFGNGAAARISPVGWYAQSIEEVNKLSDLITGVTHNHPEGMKAARVVATCIFMAKNGSSKEEIKKFIESNYDINFNYQELVDKYDFDISCQGSVPQALYCFVISESFEDALRTAVSIGGDTDTIAAITTSIASAFYDDGKELLEQTFEQIEELGDIAKEFVMTCKKRLD